MNAVVWTWIIFAFIVSAGATRKDEADSENEVIVPAVQVASHPIAQWAGATRKDETDSENELIVPAVQVASHPVEVASHPMRPMKFVAADVVMNRFDHDHDSGYKALRGQSSSPPSQQVSSLPQQYIINGETAEAGRYQWFAQSYTKVNGGFYLGGCGAVLIAPEWIATAAHCVDGTIQPTHFEVGTYCPPPYSFLNCNEKREFGKVKHRYLHEDWGISLDGGPINDIALFQLESPIESVVPIDVDAGDLDLSHGGDLTAIGIGVVNQRTGESASVLQEVGMRYVSKEQCKLLFRGAFKESHMICAFGEDKGTCSGDSGGPIFASTNSTKPRDVLVGITSFGAVKCAGPFPDVYTSTADMMGWIRGKVCNTGEIENQPAWCSDADSTAPSSQNVAPATATGIDNICADDMDATYLHNPLSSRPQKSCQWLANKDAARREKVCREKPNARVICTDTCEGRCQPS